MVVVRLTGPARPEGLRRLQGSGNYILYNDVVIIVNHAASTYLYEILRAMSVDAYPGMRLVVGPNYRLMVLSSLEKSQLVWVRSGSITQRLLSLWNKGVLKLRHCRLLRTK